MTVVRAIHSGRSLARCRWVITNIHQETCEAKPGIALVHIGSGVVEPVHEVQASGTEPVARIGKIPTL